MNLEFGLWTSPVDLGQLPDTQGYLRLLSEPCTLYTHSDPLKVRSEILETAQSLNY